MKHLYAMHTLFLTIFTVSAVLVTVIKGIVALERARAATGT
jgi:hypothetical protein